MSNSKDTVSHTVLVALVLCIVCSVIVAGSAVILKPTQMVNKELDRNKNILAAAGLYRDGEHGNDDITRLFEQFDVRAVNLETGSFANEEELAAAGVDLSTYDQRAASRDPALSRALSNDEDLAGINRLPRYALVYVLPGESGIDRIVLPVHGYGLWGTLYGYLAMEGDGETVVGLGFYEHKETPGLGAEVDNPAWKRQWTGKQLYDDSGALAIRVAKGRVDAQGAGASHQVDGLSGATLTSRGVTNMLQFWLGDKGFGLLLNRLRGEQV